MLSRADPDPDERDVVSGGTLARSRPIRVAIVGATGAVGRTMVDVLEERSFPVSEVRLFGSGRSAGTVIETGFGPLTVEVARRESFESVDIALFTAGGDMSLALAPAAVRRGAVVIDNSSAWRMHRRVPLVVSQVNPQDLARHNGIIANPNCSAMQLAPPLMALRDRVGLRRVIVATYQSVGGTGAKPSPSCPLRSRRS